MAKILIAFYSREKSTERLALAISEGAKSAGGEVRLRRARELVDETAMGAVPGWSDRAAEMNALYEPPTVEDAEWADAIILGSPSRFGLVSSELKAFLDSLGGLWMQGKLIGKVGSAFTSTSSAHGGNEMANFTMFVPMAHFGMIIVPPGYADPAMFAAGTPYGASAITGGRPPGTISDEETAAATFQGKRVAQIAQRLSG